MTLAALSAAGLLVSILILARLKAKLRAKAEPNLPITHISDNINRLGRSPAQSRKETGFHVALIHPDGQPEAAGPKSTEEQLHFVNTLFATAVENSPNGFVVIGAGKRILASNPRFFDMWRIPVNSPASTLDGGLLDAMSATLKDPLRFRASLEDVNEQAPEELDFLDGRIFEWRSAALHDPKRVSLGRMYFFLDVTERKRAERDLARLARTDPLTGLANRTTFLDRLGLALAACRRGDTPFAVHYLDLDNFKNVNDSLGHQIGDGLLKGVAGRLASSVRVTDLVARLGGDEFAVLQADVTDPSSAGTLAAKLRAVLAPPFQIEGNVVRVTATVGIASFMPEIETASQILAQADRALYRAKEEGRDRYRFHSQELDRIVHDRISLAEELRSAIDRDELQVYYQPQVAVATGQIVGVEALVRWNHPRRGQLKPGIFLLAAERTGVIVPLGSWVLENACRQFREWRDQGIAPPVLAVNLSAAQLKQGHDLERDITATLAKWGLAPQDLELDVPETVLAGSLASHLDVLQNLHQLGVGIAIDDFGADYTSMGRIAAYQVKRLKIAPELIASMTSNPMDADAVRMMIHLAAQLGVDVVAKSVETGEQEEFLRANAIAAGAQGYLYSEPLPALQITDLLRQKRIVPAAKNRTPAQAAETVK